ncbi:NYN domain-containing protein [Rhodomicrobium sp.]|uniref:NYN domain-containing protein n=1 Tax=Rhodomicrobium sp. TaxID=2720632 RepID=UPI0039E2DD5A
MIKTALLIDGGYVRAGAQAAGLAYDNTFIQTFAASCVQAQDEYLLRVLYYDSPQYKGRVALPVSGRWTNFQANDRWLDDLAKLDRFAVRRGTMGFRGWKLKQIPYVANRPPTDADFAPNFEQKGVDMRVGLDIAAYSNSHVVDRIVLVSGDQDMIPAMKHARKAGLEMVLIELPAPTQPIHDNLRIHTDLIRSVAWPAVVAQPENNQVLPAAAE